MGSEDSVVRLTCPAGMCRTDNDVHAEACERCGLPLRGLARLSIYPAHLFNMGLSAARGNQMACARDLFAAVVYWCPMDYEARNALAMACFALGDETEARHHWETVLRQLPANTLAARGLEAIESAKKSREIDEAKQRIQSKRKYGRSKRKRTVR
jgi:hypothetical protein